MGEEGGDGGGEGGEGGGGAGASKEGVATIGERRRKVAEEAKLLSLFIKEYYQGALSRNIIKEYYQGILSRNIIKEYYQGMLSRNIIKESVFLPSAIAGKN